MPRAINQDFVFRALKRGKGIEDTTEAIQKSKRANEDYADSARDTSRASNEAEGGMSRFSAAAGKLGNVLKGGFTVAIGVAGGALTAAVTDFLAAEESMRKFSAQTGITGAALDEFQDVAQGLYLQGLGSSFDEVVSAMQQVHTLTGAVNTEMESELTNLTRRALRFANVFDTDLTEGIRTADIVATNFGISGSNAFDILTTAMQQTGDPAGDLLDTFTEYSANFADLGLDAADMFAILNSGLEAGARNTDDIADGVREFGIRIQDGTANIGLWRAGLSGVKYQFDQGQISGEEFFNAVIQGLNDMEDPQQRFLAGQELFGSKWEDVGESAFLALETSDQKMRDFIGSTDEAGRTLEQGPGHAFDLFKRNAIAAIQDNALPLLDKLSVGMANGLVAWGNIGTGVRDLITGLSEASLSEIGGMALQIGETILANLVPGGGVLIEGVNFGARIVGSIISGIRATVGIASAIIDAFSGESIGGILEAAWNMGVRVVDMIVEALKLIPTQIIDILNGALPDSINLGTHRIFEGTPFQQTFSVDLDLPDNPIPGGSRDVGGPAFPGVSYEIGQGPYKEFFVPTVPGQIMTPGQAMGGAGGLQLSGNFVFQGVQNPREMERQLGGLAQRQNRMKTRGRA